METQTPQGDNALYRLIQNYEPEKAQAADLMVQQAQLMANYQSL